MGQIQDTLMGFQGTMDISSEVGTGTAVTLTLPKAAPPALITQLVLHPRDVLCLIGSDASSESIMRKKLEENPETLRVFSDVKSAQKELNDTSIHHILLVDDIKNEPVPEKTEHCTPYRLVSRDAILPMTPYLLKSLLLYVPVTWVQETQNSHYDHIELVILENSIPLVTALKYVLRNHHREAQTDFYDNTLDFLTAYTHYTKTTRFCIDYNLPGAKNGIDIIQILHRSGYRNLYLCTGLEVSDLNMQMLEGVRIISKGDWKKLEKVILGQ